MVGSRLSYHRTENICQAGNDLLLLRMSMRSCRLQLLIHIHGAFPVGAGRPSLLRRARMLSSFSSTPSQTYDDHDEHNEEFAGMGFVTDLGGFTGSGVSSRRCN